MVPSTSRIAFGSCNEQDLQNNLWSIIEERDPAAFIWGGDAIYGGELRTEDAAWVSVVKESHHRVSPCILLCHWL
jgi:hypothetical protein